MSVTWNPGNPCVLTHAPQIMLEQLGSDCTDLQSLRELTVNGLDAITGLGDRAVGCVVWDLDWLRFDGSGARVRK